MTEPQPDNSQNSSSHQRVFVRDLELLAELGVHPHEKSNAQPIILNIDVWVDHNKAALTDEIGDAVCYEDIVNDVKAVLAEGRVNLVETLAELIANICLERPAVNKAQVRIEKPMAIEEAKSAGIEVTRYR